MDQETFDYLSEEISLDDLIGRNRAGDLYVEGQSHDMFEATHVWIQSLMLWRLSFTFPPEPVSKFHQSRAYHFRLRRRLTRPYPDEYDVPGSYDPYPS